MNRRAVLAIVASLIGGCSSFTPANPGDIATHSERSATPPDLPRPGEPCTVTSLPDTVYPPLPDELTEASARQFARGFETAYATATIRADPSEDPNGVDGRDVAVQESTERGHVVRVSLEINVASNETETEVDGTGVFTALGTTVSTGWYYVTERFAMRAAERGNDSLINANWKTVACTPAD